MTVDKIHLIIKSVIIVESTVHLFFIREKNDATLSIFPPQWESRKVEFVEEATWLILPVAYACLKD